ncbi:T9SS type A sorting domain-containing protein [Aequorivita capsosiphonis]|uniref:T9SS type A sorting domain-containing protein n=1 Tax=Aequorivita capsosiphonis TaxID=487317 RepID=UPI0004293DC4|nr:T9SS type A sorting domain-containing protein [Aequorivita capsosiphonis]
MIKKLSLFLSFALPAAASFAQTIVSTSPQDQNVVLEEYTGIHCTFCPSGHTISKGLQDANPDRVSLIYIHNGGYAVPGNGEPDFRTPWGSAIVNQSYSGSGFGYPAATVNRHVFPGRSMASGGGTAMARPYWVISANETMTKISPVNLAVEASIDVQTNVMTVHVEGYYTSDSPEATNLLNIALLQNNTIGPQTGGGAGNNYVHMHRLVEMITSQWGEVINNTTANTFVDRTFTYTIPTAYNDVPTVLEDMEVVAYISNTHQEIPTGHSALPTFTGLTIANDAALLEIPEIISTCADEFGTDIIVKNLGIEPLTSMAIQYSINGEPHTYNWTGNILSLRKETMSLPPVDYTLNNENTFEVTLPSDDNNSNNSLSTTFEKAPQGTGLVNLELITDNWGYEMGWKILDSNGDIVASGDSPYSNSTINIELSLEADCYSIVLTDSGNNGGTTVTLTDSQGTQLFFAEGNWSSDRKGNFRSNGVLEINKLDTDRIQLYPNPAATELNLSNAENTTIEIYTILGTMILSRKNISINEQIDITNFQNGTYFIKISKDNITSTKRFLISK